MSYHINSNLRDKEIKMKYPKIYLTLDNCFAIKRWVEPETWGPLIKELGFDYIEASFDNEMDLLYSSKEYLKEWFKRLAVVEKESDVKVPNFFTGYQTYRTAGLAHPDEKMSKHLFENWMKPAIEILGKRGSGIGFSFHAYPDNVLQDPELYEKETKRITQTMSELGRLAKNNGEINVCVEAMYAPHQTPFTIDGTYKFLKDIYTVAGYPIYTTVDVGHMVGQVLFRKPTKDEIRIKLEKEIETNEKQNIWLGSENGFKLWKAAVFKKESSLEVVQKIWDDMKKYDYLFSFTKKDSDPYAWLEELGCYSPIVHMQQTNGVTSSHGAFTEENNQNGIIKGDLLLKALAKSYEKEDISMPPKVDKVYLSFEIFASNIEYPENIKQKLMDTCRYWRKYVPRDGMYLNELLDLIENKEGCTN